ncbi:unnamed protein product [Effrenium voratum]|uniref:Uncharacterized protein n=1 Tax=Effrenium voratum TaxID=2562239 RepID=A0AA36MX69_9DINO|nr:unnamed protein product [Effrenium voratum]
MTRTGENHACHLGLYRFGFCVQLRLGGIAAASPATFPNPEPSPPPRPRAPSSPTPTPNTQLPPPTPPKQPPSRRNAKVSICFSKGLGAPVGSVLCGPTDFIAKARRLRKAVGGGLRQVGVLAAAQLYALDHNLERLHEDHENASRLAAGLKALGLHVLPAPTNIVFFDVDEAPQVVASLGQRGVRILCTDGRRRCRAVTHLHIRSKDIDYFLTQISEILSKELQAQSAAISAWLAHVGMVLAALHPALAEAAEAVWRGEVLLAGPKEEIGGVKGVAAGETGEPQLLRELQPDSYDLVLEVQSDEVLAAGWEAWCNRFYPLGGHSFSLANSFIINLASIAKVLRTGGKFIFLTTAESKDEILPFAFLQLPHLKWQIEQLPAHASGVSAVCCTLQADAAQALRSTPQVVAEQCTAETSRRRYFEALRPYLKGESAALRILDYGCGDGSLMSWAYDEEILAEDGPPPAVTLLEANPELAARAKAKLRLAEVIHHEGEDWPFEDGAFDVAVVAFVLHHVPLEARRSLLREARRVARKVLVLEDLPGAEAASARLAWQVTQEHFRPFGQDPEDFLPHVWPWDRWLQLFDEAGLSSRSSRRIAGSLRYPE